MHKLENMFDGGDGGSNLFIWVVKGFLLVVTGWLTWSFLSYVMGPDKQVIAAIGLVAFEGGILMWPHLYKTEAVAPDLRIVTIIMIVISLAGILLAALGETIRYNQGAAELLAWVAPVMPLAVIAIVVVNVAAYTYVQINSPRAKLDRQQRLADLAGVQADTIQARYEAAKKIRDAERKYSLNGLDQDGGGSPLPPPPDFPTHQPGTSTQR